MVIFFINLPIIYLFKLTDSFQNLDLSLAQAQTTSNSGLANVCQLQSGLKAYCENDIKKCCNGESPNCPDNYISKCIKKSKGIYFACCRRNRCSYNSVICKSFLSSSSSSGDCFPCSTISCLANNNCKEINGCGMCEVCSSINCPLPNGCEYKDPKFENGCKIDCGTLICSSSSGDCSPCSLTTCQKGKTCIEVAGCGYCVCTINVTCMQPPPGCEIKDSKFDGECQVDCGMLVCSSSGGSKSCQSCLNVSDCSSGKICLGNNCSLPTLQVNAYGTLGVNRDITAASLIVFKNKMWVIGGFNDQNNNWSKKVFYSSDGITWEEAGNDSLPYPISSPSAVVFNNKMWVTGGNYRANFYKKVIYSEDGINWTGAEQDVLPESIEASFVFNNKIWVLGRSGKIYFSENGLNWSFVGNKPSNIAFPTPAVFDNKIWLIGGVDLTQFSPEKLSKRIYYTNDGITWNEIGPNWSEPGTVGLPVGIKFHQIINFDNKIWIIGGTIGEYKTSNQKLYYSSDGVHWQVISLISLPYLSQNHSAVNFNDKIVILGGFNNPGKTYEITFDPVLNSCK